MHNIENAKKFVFDRLYCPLTHLIYDYVTGDGEDGCTRHLPTPEEIRNDIPNPCSWGVGMEDSVLNGTSMIEACLAEYEVTKNEALRETVADLFQGLYLCATVAKDRGFLARSVHPTDKKSHYSNSSRDQYTHWVYAGVRLFDSPLATEEMKSQIREVLVSFAEKADRDVCPENSNSLLRTDGKPAFCCEMLPPLEPHECMRLPMIYLGAYRVTKDPHWLAQYRRHRDWALEGSEGVKPDGYPWAYCVLQMQYALRLVWEEETEEPYRSRLSALMARVAEGAAVYSKKTADAFAGQKTPNTGISKFPEWRKYPHSYYFGKPLYGKAFLVPEVYRENPERQILRNGAEAMIIHALCPDRPIPKGEARDFATLAERLDFSKASNYWPVLWIDAYWLLRALGAVDA